MTLVVRDEVDIIGANLAYHYAKGVDHVFAMDNGSVDGTVEVLESFAQDGRLTLLHEPSRDFRQGEWVTRLAHLARETQAVDWIIPNDADEFWRPVEGDLKSALQNRSPRPLICDRVNLVADTAAVKAGPWHQALKWRVRRPARLRLPKDIYGDRLGKPYFYYALPPKVLVPAPGLASVDIGNHGARMTDGRTAETCAAIQVHHFPIRSIASFAAAAESIGSAAEADADLPIDVHWKSRRWFRMIERDGNAERAFAEALPSPSRLRRDRLLGTVARDETVLDELRRLGAVPRI